MAEPASEPTAKSSSGPAFDELYAKLEETTRKLEEGNLGLEPSIALYEEGAELVVKLRTILASAEMRIRKVQARLTEDPNEPAAMAEPPGDYDGEYADVEDD